MELKNVLIPLLVLGSLVYFNYSLNQSENNKPFSQEFENFKVKYNKSYGGSDEEYRYKIFEENYRYILSENEKKQSFKLGVNEFTDLSFEEFKNIYLNKNISNGGLTANANLRLSGRFTKTFSHRTAGHVSPVKNQGGCGSCWAFSTTGALEHLSLVSGGNQTYSEQELVDCSRRYGNHGCQGGLMNLAVNYVKDHGLNLDSEYNYQGMNMQCRKRDQSDSVLTPGSVTYAQAFHKRTISEIENIVDGSVVAIAVAASPAFQSYHSGVLPGSRCGSQLNHGVLLTGYSKEDNTVEVKNSWGSWGEQGYIRIGVNSGDCGLTLQPSIVVKH